MAQPKVVSKKLVRKMSLFDIFDVEYKGTGMPNTTVRSAFSKEGHYIGDLKMAYKLQKMGIVAEKAQEKHKTCSIGFCEKTKKWYGWSHRAMWGFSVGDVAKEGDCCTSSGWAPEYLDKHPEADLTVPVGFKAKDISDARKMAVAFADSVS